MIISIKIILIEFQQSRFRYDIVYMYTALLLTDKVNKVSSTKGFLLTLFIDNLTTASGEDVEDTDADWVSSRIVRLI